MPEHRPDFVWVGCGACWQPQDPTRPVRDFGEWEAEPMRLRPYFCRTCSTPENGHTEVFPTLWGLDLDQAYPFRRGDVAPIATTVTRWGR